MKGLTIILALGLASSDKLDRTYLPPPGAQSSDGNLSAVDVPLDLPRETPLATTRPRPKIQVKPDDTQLTVGINRGQPSETGAPLGISPTTGSFVSTYIPSSTPFYTHTTTPEGFGTTVSPTSPTGLPSQSLNQYGEEQVQQVTSTPETFQGFGPVYGKNGEVIGVTSTPGTEAVSPTAASVQGLRPFYGKHREIIGVTASPGTLVSCEDGDLNCQKQSQQNVPVYDPNGQVIGYKPSFITTPGTEQGLLPTYGQSKEIIGVTPVPGTIKACKEDDVSCHKTTKQIVPIYDPSVKIIGYQPSAQSVPESLQGLRTQEQQINPIYGTNSQIISHYPSKTPTLKTVQNLQSVYSPSDHIISQQPTLGTVKVCNEGDVQCNKEVQQNVPIYGHKGQVVGYQPVASPTPGTKQSLRPIYEQNREIIGVTPTAGTVEEQTIVPVYGNDGKIIGFKPNVIPGTGTVQEFRPTYGPSGQIIRHQSTPINIKVCKDGDVECQEQVQQNIPVYSPSGQIVGYHPSIISPTSGTSQDTESQGQQIVPVYGPSGQVIGFQPNITTKTEITQGLQPVYSTGGQIIGQKSTSRIVQACNEGDVQCQKQNQKYIPIYSPKGQFVDYQLSGTPTSGTEQDSSSIYGQNRAVIGKTSQPRNMAGEEIVPVYDNVGQIIGYKPSVIPTTKIVQDFQPIYDLDGQVIGQQPTPSRVQVCKEGKCQKQAQQNVPVYDPSRKIIGYQPSVTPTPEISQGLGSQGQQIIPVYGPSGQVIGYQPSVNSTPETGQGFHPFYGHSGQIISQQPILATVKVCKEDDVQCQKKVLQNIPVNGPSGQIIGYQPSVTLTPGTSQDLGSQRQQIIPVYGSSGQIVGYQPSVIPSPGTVQGLKPVYGPSVEILSHQPTPSTVQVCREDDVQCQKKALQNIPVYGPSGQIIGYQPIVIPKPGTSQDLGSQRQQIIPVYGPSGQIVGYQPSVIPTLGTVQGLKPVYGLSGENLSQQPTPATVQVCREGDVQCQKKTLQNVPVYGPSGLIVGYEPRVTPGVLQKLQPLYNLNGKIVGQRPSGLVQGCKEDDVQCQYQDKQFIPIYGPNGQVIGQQLDVTPTPGMVQGLQPVYQQQITTPKPEVVQICREGDIQCQLKIQKVRPVDGLNGQLMGQQVTSSPETVPSLKPVYGLNGQIIGQQPTVVSPTTGKPIYGGTKNIFQPGSTAKPYFQPSAISTTSAPLKKYGTTPTEIFTTSSVFNTERPLSESDKKAVTINYDFVLTPDSYSYNFDTSNGIHVDETGIVKDGNKAVGTYSYIGDDGKKYEVTYKADKNGFQPTGDHLPTPHPIPADIQRVIEQAAKDKQEGIFDDGSYNKAKYGYEKYNQPSRLQSGDQPDLATTGREPSSPSNDENFKQEEGYYYNPPLHFARRGQIKRPQEKYEDRPKTSSVNHGREHSNEQGVPEYKPNGGLESSTIYKPTGTTRPVQVNKYEITVPSRPAQGIGTTTYRPSVSLQGQVDKFGRPITLQPGQEPIGTYEPVQKDKYKRPISTRPRQGYTTSSYRPIGTHETSNEEKFGKPIYSKPEEELSEIAQSDQEDKYGRPITSEAGQGIGSSTFRTTVSSAPSQVDKLRRPIYPQSREEPVQVNEFGKASKPSRPGQGVSSTTFRPTEKSQPRKENKFRRPIYSQVGEESFETSEPGQVDNYGRPLSTYRPTLSSQPAQVDKFGRPIYLQPEEKPSRISESGQADGYEIPIPSRPEKGNGRNTYRPTVKGQPIQVKKFGGPTYSQTEEEISETTEPSQTDEYGRPIPPRSGQENSSTTDRPNVTVQPTQVDKFERPIYSQSGEEHFETVKPGLVDVYGRPISSRPGQGTSSSTYSSIAKVQPTQLENFLKPIYKPGEEPNGTPEPNQVDKFGRPILSKPGQEYSVTTSRPNETTRSSVIDVFGRPISPAPKNAQQDHVDKYGRPIFGGSGQGPSSTTYRPISSAQAQGYQPGSDVFEQKPKEFGPHEKLGPGYLTPYEDKTAKLVEEDFRGPKQPSRFDPKTGYHY